MALDSTYCNASTCDSAEPGSIPMDVVLVFIFLFFAKYKSFYVHMFTNNAIACACPILVFGRASNVHIYFLICLLINLLSSSVAVERRIGEPIPGSSAGVRINTNAVTPSETPFLDILSSLIN